MDVNFSYLQSPLMHHKVWSHTNLETKRSRGRGSSPWARGTGKDGVGPRRQGAGVGGVRHRTTRVGGVELSRYQSNSTLPGLARAFTASQNYTTRGKGLAERASQSSGVRTGSTREASEAGSRRGSERALHLLIEMTELLSIFREKDHHPCIIWTVWLVTTYKWSPFKKKKNELCQLPTHLWSNTQRSMHVHLDCFLYLVEVNIVFKESRFLMTSGSNKKKKKRFLMTSVHGQNIVKPSTFIQQLLYIWAFVQTECMFASLVG